MTEPCHIVAESCDKRALCGAKDPLPKVLQRHAPAHQYEMARCFTCYQLAGLADMLPELPGQLDLFGASA